MPAPSGALDRDAILSVVRTATPKTRYCYESALRKQPTLSGTLTVAFVIGALVTPTPDVMNQAVVAVPCYLLYELGLLLARLVPAGVPRAV